MNSAVELLFSITVRVSVLILLAWGAAVLLRERSASIRHMVWTASAIGALVLLVVAPVAPTVHTTSLPVWQTCTVEVSPVHIELPSCGQPEAAAKRAASSGGTVSDADEGGAPSTAAGHGAGRHSGNVNRSRAAIGTGTYGGSAAPVVSGTSWSWSPGLSTVVVGIWTAGALVVLLTILLERLWVRRISLASREAGEKELLSEAREIARGLGLSDHVELNLSREAIPPLSWGFWKPRILLPADAIDWPESQRRAVLLHELGHARRRDVFTQTLASLACAVFWFNPLVWLAAGRMRDERERACDDLVLQSGIASTSYARCLLQQIRRLPRSSDARFVLVGMTQGPELAERIDRLVSRSGRQQPPGRTTILISILAALAVLGTLAPHVVAQPDCQDRRTASYSTSFRGPDASPA